MKNMQADNEEETLRLTEEILKLNLKLINPHARIPDKITYDADQLRHILSGLQQVQKDMAQKTDYITMRTKRLNVIVDVLLEYTLMDFSRQIPISELGDEVDAVALGLNTLGEELSDHITKLREKSEDLLKSNRQLEQFVYVASHDLHEPLKTLSNYVSLFEENYKSGEHSAKYFEVINRATARMRALIGDLLEYARVGQEQTPVSIDCNVIVSEVLENMASSISESGATIKVEPLPAINGQHFEIRSLFQNLVSNAIKFRKKEEPLTIHIKAHSDNGQWIFSVRDNGIGIDKEYHERIFLIFQKLHGKKEYPGTGIGLAHCQKVVETYGGTIWVESEPGKGSTFYFTIPQATHT